ncbi:RNA 3'-terminal phosphate cyclase [Planctomycetales bacterium ZRK34]|nr:RNA 3'-terminal phosphate cyclase [Planctomycetales bacterium ZRK34]
MLNIDGSQGEGGGQVLRSALSLSMVTGQGFRIARIRAGRKKPGLMRQHLTAVGAATALCGATVSGDAIGSTELTFSPGKVEAGEHTFSVGTAGSTTLVLQTVLPALLTAGAPSRLTLEGGTHNPFAPPFDFLAKTFLPLVNRMGPRVEATLERAGFYPAGGGRFTVEVTPAAQLSGIELLERGEIMRRSVRGIVSNLPRGIAERELKAVRKKLSWPDECFEVVELRDGHGPGNVVMIEIESEQVCEVFTGFGEVNRPAEAVANHATQQAQRYLRCGAPVGEYLADQLLLPLALAGAGAFETVRLSRHTRTHIDLIGRFCDVSIQTDDHGRDGATVRLG